VQNKEKNRMPVLQSNIIRLTINYRLPNNDIAQNVTHFQYLDAPTLTDEEVLDDLEPWVVGWSQVWELLGSTAVDLETFEASVYTIANKFIGLGERSLNITGNAVTDMLPPGVAGLITRQVSGTSGTAKKFLVGQTEGQQDQGVFDIPSVALMASVGIAWNRNPDFYVGVTNNYNQVAFKKQYNIGYLMNPTVTVNPIVAYQRRRKQNVGS